MLAYESEVLRKLPYIISGAHFALSNIYIRLIERVSYLLEQSNNIDATPPLAN